MAELQAEIERRRQIEESLRRFELIAEHSRDIVLFMRLDNGSIIEANTAAENAYGYSREELLTLSIQDLRAIESRGATADQMGKADHHGILFETVHRRKDGSTFPVEVSSQGATVGGVRMLVSIIRNITDRKHFEEKLRKSEEKYRKIFEGAIEGIYQTTMEGRYLNVNPAFARMFGFSSPREMIESVTDIGRQLYVNPQNREYMLRMLIEHDNVESFEVEMYRKDKSKFWISSNMHTIRDEAGEILYFEGTNIDITERKHAGNELLESQRDLKRAQAVAHTGSWQLDLVRNELLWSDETYRIFNIPKGTPMTYEVFLSTIHPEDRECVDRKWKAALFGELYDVEHRIIVGDSIKWVRERAELDLVFLLIN